MDMKILQDPKFIIISILILIIAVISIIKFHTMLAGILCIGLALIAIKICYNSITPSQTNKNVNNVEENTINEALITGAPSSAFNPDIAPSQTNTEVDNGVRVLNEQRCFIDLSTWVVYSTTWIKSEASPKLTDLKPNIGIYIHQQYTYHLI